MIHHQEVAVLMVDSHGHRWLIVGHHELQLCLLHCLRKGPRWYPHWIWSLWSALSSYSKPSISGLHWRREWGLSLDVYQHSIVNRHALLLSLYNGVIQNSSYVPILYNFYSDSSQCIISVSPDINPNKSALCLRSDIECTCLYKLIV